MRKTNLQCIFIGNRSKTYNDLILTMTSLDLNKTISTNYISAEKDQIQKQLKKVQGVGIVFISDDVSFSLALLSDLIWQNSPELNIVLITEKTASTNVTKVFNNTDFSKLLYKKDSTNTKLWINFLFQIIQSKKDFRCCKGLLGISERRSLWLVDSNSRAITYISRDLHLYANSSYLKLFGFDTVNSSSKHITKIPLRDLINPDEHKLFDDYLKNQLRSNNIGRSLILSFRTINGKEVRAKIVVFIALFQGRKCFQMWVEPVHIYKNIFPEQHSQQTTPNGNNRISVNENIEQQNLNSKEMIKTNSTHISKVSTVALLEKVIKNKDATLQVTKLKVMENLTDNANYIVSLKIDPKKKDQINKLLSLKSEKTSAFKQDIFWDQLVIRLLLNTLTKKPQINNKLFISLTGTSIRNERFTKWLFKGLEALDKRASCLVFTINAEKEQSQKSEIAHFIDQLSSCGCAVLFSYFSASKQSLSLLKVHKPEFISLSKSWLKTIDKNEAREVLLGRFIRQFESKNIKVIAPCNYNKNLNKVFTLSGASFCHGGL